MSYPRDLPCRHVGCGAVPGERCRPTTVLIGWHRERVEDSGVRIRDDPDRRAAREVDDRFPRYAPTVARYSVPTRYT